MSALTGKEKLFVIDMLLRDCKQTLIKENDTGIDMGTVKPLYCILRLWKLLHTGYEPIDKIFAYENARLLGLS